MPYSAATAGLRGASLAKLFKGNLTLDSMEEIMKGGANGPGIVAGDLRNSFLLRAIRYQEAD